MESSFPKNILGHQNEEILHVALFLIEHSSQATFWINSEARFLYVNEAACTLVGHPRDELLTLGVFGLDADFQPDQWDGHWERLKRNTSRRFPSRLRHRDGRLLPVEVEANHIQFGGREYNCAFVHDLTERERIQFEMTSLAAFPAQNPNPVLSCEAGGAIVFANPPARAMLRTLGDSDRLPRDLQEIVTRCWETGQGHNGYEIQAGSLTYLCSVHRVSETGRVNFYAMDITGRKRAEKALQRSEAEYRSLVEGAKYAIYWVGEDGCLLSVNPAMVKMLGYDSAEEVLRLNTREDIYRDPSVREHLRTEHAEGLDGVEVEWKRKDGSPLFVRLNGRAVRNKSRAIEYFEVIAENITERRALEKQLLQAQKMEAVGQLAGGIAHDFNNLLTVITGYSEMSLAALKESDPVYANISETKKAAERAADLTRQLLAFSRKQVLRPKVLDLNAVVSDLKRIVERVLGEHIDLSMMLDSSLASIKADPSQLEQVLMNLVVNARDAMPAGGSLTIETANAELDSAYVRKHIGARSGRFVMLAVTDTGCGMDETTKSQIFEPFFTTKEQGKGTGLGLSTVYGIVKQSGGYIWVYSEPGRGTAFKIYFPCAAENADRSQETIPAKESLGGNETILLVEDDEMVRNLAFRALQKLGYFVLEAANGAEATLICQQLERPIDLLVSDVVMPSVSGTELCSRLIAIRPEMRVLMMSGYPLGVAGGHEGVFHEGAAFLQKPFTLDTLARKVRETLDGIPARATKRSD